MLPRSFHTPEIADLLQNLLLVPRQVGRVSRHAGRRPLHLRAPVFVEFAWTSVLRQSRHACLDGSSGYKIWELVCRHHFQERAVVAFGEDLDFGRYAGVEERLDERGVERRQPCREVDQKHLAASMSSHKHQREYGVYICLGHAQGHAQSTLCTRLAIIRGTERYHEVHSRYFPIYRQKTHVLLLTGQHANVKAQEHAHMHACPHVVTCTNMQHLSGKRFECDQIKARTQAQSTHHNTTQHTNTKHKTQNTKSPQIFGRIGLRLCRCFPYQTDHFSAFTQAHGMEIDYDSCCCSRHRLSFREVRQRSRQQPPSRCQLRVDCDPLAVEIVPILSIQPLLLPKDLPINCSYALPIYRLSVSSNATKTTWIHAGIIVATL